MKPTCQILVADKEAFSAENYDSVEAYKAAQAASQQAQLDAQAKTGISSADALFRDITGVISERLVSLSVKDNEGQQTDSVTIVLENADGRLVTPEPGVRLRVFMGYTGHALRNMGDYTVSTVRESATPTQIEITAGAAVFATDNAEGALPLNHIQSRSWEAGMTVADLVRTIAAEHSLEPYTGKRAAAIVLPHLDQTDESDINFLTRLAERYNCNVKAGFGKLVFSHAQDVRATDAPNSALAPVNISKSQVTSYDYTRSARNDYRSAYASWNDLDAALLKTVWAGKENDRPAIHAGGNYATAAEALAAAESKLLNIRRTGTNLRITMPAPADLPFYAEGSIIAAEDFGEKIKGLWKLTSVEWSLSDSGLSVTLQSEVAKPEMPTNEEQRAEE